jgi:hypothetical protein
VAAVGGAGGGARRYCPASVGLCPVDRGGRLAAVLDMAGISPTKMTSGRFVGRDTDVTRAITGLLGLARCAVSGGGSVANASIFCCCCRSDLCIRVPTRGTSFGAGIKSGVLGRPFSISTANIASNSSIISIDMMNTLLWLVRNEPFYTRNFGTSKVPDFYFVEGAFSPCSASSAGCVRVGAISAAYFLNPL